MAELSYLVSLARQHDCAIVLLDPPGTLAEKLLLHLDWLGLTQRVLYDRLADSDKVLGYEWLARSQHPDPWQAEAENEERLREFAAVLLRRRDIQDPAGTPVIEEGVLAALRLYLYQPMPVPLLWLAEVFTPGSATSKHLLRHCTEPELVRNFHEYHRLSVTARRREVSPAERVLRSVCGSPAFRLRSQGATFDIAGFLDQQGILLLDGSSRGNLSRDAASVMMGAVVLRVIRHCRTGSRNKVVLVLDEAANAGLLGLHEAQAMGEALKWGLAMHVLVQDPITLPSAIRSNVLQNSDHHWFRQGSPEAARLAAEDIATPLLDPLQVHHTEYRVRSVDDGFERVQTTNWSETTAPEGWTTSRSHSWQTVLWPRRKDVREAHDRYTTLTDQILLMQKELMLLKPGCRLMRGVTVTPQVEYVPLLSDPWMACMQDDAVLGLKTGARLRAARVQSILADMKQRPAYATPPAACSPSPAMEDGPGAARRLSGPPTHAARAADVV